MSKLIAPNFFSSDFTYYYFDAANQSDIQKKRKRTVKDLMRIAEHIELNVKETAFQMDRFVSVQCFGDVSQDNEILDDQGIRDLDDATACAFGWAATMDRFNKRGLFLKLCDNPLFPDSSPYSHTYDISFNGHDESEHGVIAAELFCLTIYEFEWIFFPHWYKDGGNITRKQVIKRLRKSAKQILKHLYD